MGNWLVVSVNVKRSIIAMLGVSCRSQSRAKSAAREHLSKVGVSRVSMHAIQILGEKQEGLELAICTAENWLVDKGVPRRVACSALQEVLERVKDED